MCRIGGNGGSEDAAALLTSDSLRFVVGSLPSKIDARLFVIALKDLVTMLGGRCAIPEPGRWFRPGLPG